MTSFQNRNRNNSIDFFRFFFMILICIHHYGGMRPALLHGYMGVEFFFIVSGIFLYKSFMKQQQNPLDYLIHRVKRLWGEYFIALLFFWAVYLVWMLIRGVEFNLWDYFVRLIPDALMLQGTGLFFSGLNSPTWYVSTLIVSSTVLYCFLKFNRNLTLYIISPLACLLGYTYLTTLGTYDVYYLYNGGFFIPLIRAFAGLSSGVLISSIVEQKCLALKDRHRIYDYLGVASFVLLFVFLFSDYVLDGKNYSDSLLLLFITIIVLECMIDGSLFQRLFKGSVWESLGGVSYEMLLLHAPIMIVVNYLRKLIELNDLIWLVLYLLVVIFCSYCFKYVYTLINQSISSIQSKH